MQDRFIGPNAWMHGLLGSLGDGNGAPEGWKSIPGGSLGPLRGILAAMVGSLGLLLESWEAPGAVLEASWNLLKPSWSHLGDVVGALASTWTSSSK